jgi:hypothetical protein
VPRAPGPRHSPVLSARRTPTASLPDDLRKLMDLADIATRTPFRGVSTSSGPEPGLFRLGPTGVPTAPLREAANSFLESLHEAQLKEGVFPVTSDMWRRWNNTHPFLTRHGLCLEELSDRQRDLALQVVRSALSERAFAIARDVMRLNETLYEITGSAEEYGEWLYWLSIMGNPSESSWGFQFDGHHVNVNCMVIGDQVVVTPTFLGSEPVTARLGRYRGTSVLAEEEAVGLKLAQSLTAGQFEQAHIGDVLPGDVFTSCYRDNYELEYDGIAFAELDSGQQAQLIDLVRGYVGWVRPSHAGLRLDEVMRHIERSCFAWIGERGERAPFYYRVYNPVILIEFDHLAGIALDNDEPSRDHIHTIVRTPNGNDYGMDLLRQHYDLAHGRQH